MTVARSVYFPLASNAHSLLAGRPLESVRRRLKMASLLHEELFLESGSLQIQAGEKGAVVFGNPSSGDSSEWQTPAQRGALQSSEFLLTLRPTSTSVNLDQPVTLRSSSAIAWSPTFEPFRREFTSDTSWIQIGRFTPATDEERSQGRSWRRRDDSNPAIARRLPDSLVRDQVLSNIEKDLLVAAARGVNISIDPLHSAVLSSRLIDPRLEAKGFALPFIAPRAGGMSWKDIAQVRAHKSIALLRAVLSDIERESLDQINALGELPDSVARAYRARIERYALDTPSIGSAVGYGVAEMAVGRAIGFATAGIGWAGILIGAIPGAAVTAADAIAATRARRKRDWISALQAIARPGS